MLFLGLKYFLCFPVFWEHKYKSSPWLETIYMRCITSPTPSLWLYCLLLYALHQSQRDFCGVLQTCLADFCLRTFALAGMLCVDHSPIWTSHCWLLVIQSSAKCHNFRKVFPESTQSKVATNSLFNTTLIFHAALVS